MVIVVVVVVRMLYSLDRRESSPCQLLALAMFPRTGQPAVEWSTGYMLLVLQKKLDKPLNGNE
jgi:hypothetical protein